MKTEYGVGAARQLRLALRQRMQARAPRRLIRLAPGEMQVELEMPGFRSLQP